MTRCDLAIIGAGPAGLAAAAEAAGLGLSVVLLDEQPRPGGQIYRDVDRAGRLRGRILGADYLHGASLTGAVRAPGVTHIEQAKVWNLTVEGEVTYTRGEETAQISAKRLLLATGALERPMPLPGWTLPGVMTAGAGQILLKQSGLVARRAVLVGSGPLLYLVAVQMVRAGAPPLALVETPGGLGRALGALPQALRGWRTLMKGTGLLRELRRAGVRRYRRARDITIEGEGAATGLRFSAGGAQFIACDTVLLHHGVVPNVQISRALRLDHRWEAGQACFAPVLDAWGRSSAEAVFIAGDGAGIAGAKAAEYAGRVSAAEIARDLGRITQDERDRRSAGSRRALDAERAVRPFLDLAFPPAAEALAPADDTIVCRCEEVTGGDVRKTIRQGCLGPNQMKAFNRAGMGPCQGRYCGLTVTQILSQATGADPEATGYYRLRPPIKPVTLSEVAQLSEHQNPGADSKESRS
ncbi:FAD/NAD(P)-dependent oxidoreductase [Acidimangrovimonas sediminis]|uniref:FAD/NAD(P)-dependent oxidoreductase n=1 Tax=Acidimangrovimonas sediminis TaxID=2056283 RepID=UPI000C802BEE|nr:NAD(P)/FAD-dependent oxidoreductase [Acidimangrovimonas sediminis]